MGKITVFFKRKSIKTAFTTFMFICIVSALLLSLVLSNICQWGQSRYYINYKIQFKEFVVSDPEMVIGFDKTDENEQKGSISNQIPLITSTNQIIYNILGFLSVGVYPICFIFCIVVTSVLFYKRQLQKPIAILDYEIGRAHV